MSNSMVMIMAGGKGSRLGPLTCHRAKPATPFGGRYRIIDFVLSNFVNSRYRRIYVLTQYMAGSLIRHLGRTWHLAGYDQFIEVSPAQMRRGDHWYLGTADSIYQNLNLVLDHPSPHVAIFGGDHIYKCDIRQMEAVHRAKKADLTIAAFPVPRTEAHQFGVIQIDANGKVRGFQEKPADPTPIPGDPDTCLVSMGNYFFRTPVLENALNKDAADPDSSHDFGKDIIPSLLAEGKAIYVYDFAEQKVPGDPNSNQPYWRDVGTIDSYFRANMELRSPLPHLNMYNRQWPVRTAHRHHPPARFVRHRGGTPVDIDDCLICEGSVIQSAVLRRAMIGYDCFVHVGARIETSLLLSGCDVGANSQLHHVLCDKNCSFEAGVQIGVSPKEDAQRFPFITESGIIVLPKGTRVPKEGPIILTQDMAQVLWTDPATRDQMAAVPIKPVVSHKRTHSFRSHGPDSSLGLLGVPANATG